MKQLIIIFLLLGMLVSVTNAQVVSSSCSAPDSIKALYQDDADRLGLRKTFDDNSVWKDSINLDATLSNAILGALLAVYNADSLAARDTLVQLDVHQFPSLFIEEVYIYADTNANWVKNLNAGIHPSGMKKLDSLIQKHNFSIIPEGYSPSSNAYSFKLLSQINLNVIFLGSLINNWDDIVYAFPDGAYGEGGTIEISLSNHFALLTYSYGWTDCILGCWYRRYWQFRVNLSDCSVQYLGSYGDVLPKNILNLQQGKQKEIKVFPNPFTTTVELEGVEEGKEYKLLSIAGATVKRGRIANGKISELENLAPGVYFLELHSGIGEQKFKLVKN